MLMHVVCLIDACRQKELADPGRQECEATNAELQRQVEVVNAREYRTSLKLSAVREERDALGVELDEALDAIERNEQVLADAEKRIEDFRAAATPVIR